MLLITSYSSIKLLVSFFIYIQIWSWRNTLFFIFFFFNFGLFDLDYWVKPSYLWTWIEL